MQISPEVRLRAPFFNARPDPAHEPLAAGAARCRTTVLFLLTHLAVVAAAYAAAVIHADGHELKAGTIGAGHVEHLGQMLLVPIAATEVRP
ncbi:hypothetical protein [Acidovorax sp. SDU_ACID1]|uniref:hypothetical protein n=1 Tax=Acidovorax sp. SDU_ACID1 TaxID=3136632 RepID=UPI003873BDFB